MTINELVSEAKKWSNSEKIELCRFISQNITIAIRSINSYTDISNTEKLEAIKWINEFHHRMNNIKFDIERVIDKSDNIERIREHAIYYAKQSEIGKKEISEILRLSYNSMIGKVENKRKMHFKESIFDLIETENFRKRIGMYIAETKITTLKGFIDGYFYALDSKEIHLSETEPKFEKFHEWVAMYFLGHNSAKEWKNIILEECNGNEREAVKLFFEIYDKFKKSEINQNIEE